MRYSNLSIETVASKTELLDILVKNRAEHAAIVAESAVGYAKAATKALMEKIDELQKNNKALLMFSLSPPIDCTNVYDTAIKMISMHKNDTVTLAADEFRNLVEDIWDWSPTFYATGKLYSGLAADSAARKGF